MKVTEENRRAVMSQLENMLREEAEDLNLLKDIRKEKQIGIVASYMYGYFEDLITDIEANHPEILKDERINILRQDARAMMETIQILLEE